MSILKITKGATYRDTLRWAGGACVLKSATLIAAAPVRFECVDHGLLDGWPVQIEGSSNISSKKTFPAKVLDSDTFEISCMNGAGFNGGSVQLRYHPPIDMDGYTALMQIRNKAGGIVLVELSTANGRITIDNAERTITREIPASVTANLTAKSGAYDMEMVQGDYVVKIDSGTVKIVDEITAP